MKPRDETKPQPDTQAPHPEPDQKAGIDSEVGDLDPDADDDEDTLPGRAGGGLAGG